MTTEAALKAWKTRRANGWVHPNSRVKNLRTQAALKAWETRRRNARTAKKQARK